MKLRSTRFEPVAVIRGEGDERLNWAKADKMLRPDATYDFACAALLATTCDTAELAIER
ncbi:hypothetical protein SS05631_c16510 [Sinorhizobium sp. CCBAU 05631]|nr:hypothetical protein SS05631_c16510 [Sinorhizobium sp. CCBAU 05631]AWM25065.1 hypothetical protein AOX55_00001811 [Sinorhizobium fredii CCBAU 25509]